MQIVLVHNIKLNKHHEMENIYIIRLYIIRKALS